MRRNTSIATGLGLALLLETSGCHPPPTPTLDASPKAYAQFYTSARWKTVPASGLTFTFPGYRTFDATHGAQLHLMSNDGECMLRYTEFQVDSSLAAIHGTGKLVDLPENNLPLFSIEGRTNAFLGFFKDRHFRVEIVNWGKNPSRPLEDARALGLEVIAQNPAKK